MIAFNTKLGSFSYPFSSPLTMNSHRILPALYSILLFIFIIVIFVNIEGLPNFIFILEQCATTC